MAGTGRREQHDVNANAPGAARRPFVSETHILQSELDSLLEILRRERHILDDLQSRIREAGAIMATGRDEALASTADRIAEAERQLGTAEMLRALVVAGLADRWGIPEYDLPLQSIIKHVPAEQAQVLNDDLHHLRRITRSIDLVRSSTAATARRRLEAARLAAARPGNG